MRSFIFLIVTMMAVPTYAVGQGRDRGERSAATGRTAVPRDGAVRSAPARQPDRGAEPRGETTTQRSREDKPGNAPQSSAPRDRDKNPAAVEDSRRRWRDEHPQAPSGRDHGATSPGTPRGPIARPDHGRWPYANPDRLQYRRPHTGANIVFVPYAAPVTVEREVVVEREVERDPAGPAMLVEEPVLARLILDVHPPTAQIFADGYYIGLPEDFRFENGGAVLEPGPHRIDIIERDYHPVSFDVNLARGQSATFRQRLTSMLPEPQPKPEMKAPEAPKQPAMFYLIPGCYMGNVPPKDANLPATCDITRAVSVQY